MHTSMKSIFPTLGLFTIVAGSRVAVNTSSVRAGGVFFYVAPGWIDGREPKRTPEELSNFTKGLWKARQWGEFAGVQRNTGRRILWHVQQFTVETTFGTKELVATPRRLESTWERQLKRLEKTHGTEEALEKLALLKKEEAEKNGFVCTLGRSVADENYPVCEADKIVNDETFPIKHEDVDVLAVSGDKGLHWLAKFIAMGKWNGPVLIICSQTQETCSAESVDSVLKYTSDHSEDTDKNHVRFLVVTEENQYKGREAMEFSDRYNWDWHGVDRKYKESGLAVREHRRIEPRTESILTAQSEELSKYLTMAQDMGNV